MHGAAHWIAFTIFHGGGTIIVQDHPERLDPKDVWSTIVRESVMMMVIVGDAFAKKSGVPVTVEHPEDATGKFAQAAAAGKGPDVFCWPHDRMGEWAKSGPIVPVTPAAKLIVSSPA